MYRGGEMVRIWGFLLLRRWGIANLEQMKVPRELICWIKSNLLTSISSTLVGLIALALLIRMSIPPNVYTVFSMAAFTLSASLMSHWMGRARPPAASISFAAV